MILTILKWFYGVNDLTVSYLVLIQENFYAWVIEKAFSPYFSSMNIIWKVP
jgi:hypothetical protein